MWWQVRTLLRFILAAGAAMAVLAEAVVAVTTTGAAMAVLAEAVAVVVVSIMVGPSHLSPLGGLLERGKAGRAWQTRTPVQ